MSFVCLFAVLRQVSLCSLAGSSNSSSACLSLLRTGIIVVCHHTWFMSLFVNGFYPKILPGGGVEWMVEVGGEVCQFTEIPHYKHLCIDFCSLLKTKSTKNYRQNFCFSSHFQMFLFIIILFLCRGSRLILCMVLGWCICLCSNTLPEPDLLALLVSLWSSCSLDILLLPHSSITLLCSAQTG